MRPLSIKSMAVLCVATAAMCFSGQEASAQCGGGGIGYGGGFGGGYSSGFRSVNYGGISYGGGFGGSRYGGGFQSFPVNAYRPVYSRSVYRGGSVYGGGGFRTSSCGRYRY